MNKDLIQMKALALKAAKEAGKILLKYYRRSEVKMRHKSKHEIVTPADTEAEKLILDMIKAKYPEHQILAEESGRSPKGSDFLWLVDPLDGTTNFYYKNPLFATSIALAYKQEVQFGVIWAPVTKELFTVTRGQGAFLNNRKIQVSSKSNFEDSVLTYCHGYKEKGIIKAFKIYEHFAINGFSIRQIGCASLEFAYVACGRTEAIMIAGINAWDIAAGALLVREAGGVVTDFTGRKWNLRMHDVLATNRKLGPKIVRDLEKLVK